MGINMFTPICILVKYKALDRGKSTHCKRMHIYRPESMNTRNTANVVTVVLVTKHKAVSASFPMTDYTHSIATNEMTANS